MAVTCRVLGFSKQAFYKWSAAPVTDRDWADAHLINAAIDVHHDDPEFGYRFIADELNRPGFVGDVVFRPPWVRRPGLWLWWSHGRPARTPLASGARSMSAVGWC